MQRRDVTRMKRPLRHRWIDIPWFLATGGMCLFWSCARQKHIMSCVFSDHVSPFNVSPFGLLSGNIVAKGSVVVWTEEFSSKTTDSGHTCCMHDIVLNKWITYEYDVVRVFGECVLIHTYQLTMKWNKLGMIEVTTLKVTDIYGANLMWLKSHVDIGYLLWITVLCTLPFWLLFGQSGLIQICVYNQFLIKQFFGVYFHRTSNSNQ